MSHSRVSCRLHIVFSTKGRRKSIPAGLQERLWSYMAGIAKNRKITVIAVGGASDHVHLLIAIPSTITIAKAVQEIKAVSSKWVHETFPEHENFAWQEGYSAFSVGMSQTAKTQNYIRNQKEHHRTKTFREELEAFLKAHGMDYNDDSRG